MKPAYVIAAATLGAAAYVWWQNSQAQTSTDPNASVDLTATDTAGSSFFTDIGSQVSNLFTSVSSAVSDPNVQAFLRMIRVGEGTAGADGYRTRFGGSLFNDYAAHPVGTVTANGYTSSAAGAYQFLSGTWAQLAAQYGLSDFSPASQDIGAVGLIKQQGALADVIAGRIATAIGKCNKIWASLAGSPYGQPTLTMADDLANYVNAGGNLTDGAMA